MVLMVRANRGNFIHMEYRFSCVTMLLHSRTQGRSILVNNSSTEARLDSRTVGSLLSFVS